MWNILRHNELSEIFVQSQFNKNSSTMRQACSMCSVGLGVTYCEDPSTHVRRQLHNCFLFIKQKLPNQSKLKIFFE